MQQIHGYLVAGGINMNRLSGSIVPAEQQVADARTAAFGESRPRANIDGTPR